MVLSEDKLFDLLLAGHLQNRHGLRRKCATFLVLINEELFQNQRFGLLALTLLKGRVFRAHKVESILFEAIEDDGVKVWRQDALNR